MSAGFVFRVSPADIQSYDRFDVDLDHNVAKLSIFGPNDQVSWLRRPRKVAL